MKLLYVTASLPYGTTEVFAVPELQELTRRGHEVRLAPMSRYAATPPSDALPFVPHTLYAPLLSPASLGGGAAQLTLRPGRALGVLRHVLRGQKRGVIEKNLAAFPKALWLARVARAWGADHIHGYWASVAATAAMIAGEVSGVPWSFTAHRWDIVQPNALPAKLESARFARFISQDGFDNARSVAGPLVDTKGVVIRMGVSLDAAAVEPTPLPEGTHLRVVCAATLIPRKGHRFLLEALAELKRRGLRVALTLAGGGELRAALEAQADALGIREQVTFLGNVDHAELLRLYASGAFDAFVLPSLHEGISVAVMEAMSHALPVIATDVGGTKELLTEGAGLLIPPENVPALTEALSTLITHPELRQRLAHTGRARVLELHDVRRVVDALEARFAAPLATPATAQKAVQL
jgi:colanic acid/amylovoran biosynthesis glycosyltransferase